MSSSRSSTTPATGTVRFITQRAAQAREKAGAEVRLRQVARRPTGGERETSEVQAQNAELSAEVPPTTADDIVWADAVLFGSPTPLAEVVARLRGIGMG